jgi:hypothetical protein
LRDIEIVEIDIENGGGIVFEFELVREFGESKKEKLELLEFLSCKVNREL